VAKQTGICQLLTLCLVQHGASSLVASKCYTFRSCMHALKRKKKKKKDYTFRHRFNEKPST